MDGLFTVFGLGTAFGVFCSWLYDVIRQRNLPVNHGAAFEALHGDNVLPAPEPVMPVMPVGAMEPVMNPEEESRARFFEARQGLDVAQERAKDSIFDAAPLSTEQETNTVLTTPTPLQEELHTAPVVPQETSDFTKTQDKSDVESAAPTPSLEWSFDEVLKDVEQPVHASQTHPAAEEVESISVAAASTQPVQERAAPRSDRMPCVVLLVNNVQVREVEEKDLAGLLAEFGIAPHGEQALLFQSGVAVTVENTTVQLAQV